MVQCTTARESHAQPRQARADVPNLQWVADAPLIIEREALAFAALYLDLKPDPDEPAPRFLARIFDEAAKAMWSSRT
jgi:hypothetical protein